MALNRKYMDTYLVEVYKQFIAIKDDDYKKSQEVFKGVFDKVKHKMGEHCGYFKKYSSQVLYAGSVYDGIKVSKMDEFDMDIVIRLPISYEDGENGICIENDQPGFIKMKIGNAFDHMDKQPDWEKCHKVTREWRDSEKYFIQNKFRSWMHGIVQKAVNDLKGQVEINGEIYLLTYRSSGPAFTLNVRKKNDPFILDVDLVPVIRFSAPRWPKNYRNSTEGAQVRDWLVVPKPNKSIEDETLQNRCWRLSFQDFEREMMKGCQQLKMTIRLVKKLRDTLEMKAIASYYIKTLFLWKINDNDKAFWQRKISFLFELMVEELYQAIIKKKIRYFWHEENNLIENMKPTLQKLYAEKLSEVLKSLKAGAIEKVVQYLLTAEEMAEFRQSPFYKQQELDQNVRMLRQESIKSVSSQNGEPKDVVDKPDSPKAIQMETVLLKMESMMCELTEKFDKMTNLWNEKLDALVDKVELLTDRVSIQDKKLNRLDSLLKTEKRNDEASGEMILNVLGGS